MASRTPKPRPSSTARGLGYEHQIHRERLLARHIDGTPCWWCSRPMYRDARRNPDRRTLHADHSQARSRYVRTIADRLLHGRCNEQRGDGSRDDRRPALTRRSDASDPLLGTRVFDWPPAPTNC